jgi:hypothetical protein
MTTFNESLDASSIPNTTAAHKHMLEVLVVVLDFVLGLQLQLRPSTVGAATPKAGGKLEDVIMKDVTFWCSELAGQAREVVGARSAMDELLLQQGMMRKWLRALPLLDVAASQSLLILAYLMLAPRDVRAPGGEVTNHLPGRELVTEVRA